MVLTGKHLAQRVPRHQARPLAQAVVFVARDTLVNHAQHVGGECTSHWLALASASGARTGQVLFLAQVTAFVIRDLLARTVINHAHSVKAVNTVIHGNTLQHASGALDIHGRPRVAMTAAPVHVMQGMVVTQWRHFGWMGAMNAHQVLQSPRQAMVLVHLVRKEHTRRHLD